MDAKLSMVKGPGKFEGELLVAEYVYELDADDELSNHAGDWSGRYDGLVGDALVEMDWLTAADRKFLRETFGAILRKDGFGFITATWVDTEAEMSLAWAAEIDAYPSDPDEYL